ncbi:hypothetical protein BBW65_04125 [Helicobacter enhydrae]|uniref:Uncharacterized protein n=1 Tax=Helicobacter enhydrae TaxID=222136 RepID=A0A1B1U5K7_9HELI|nr:hypothetical protein BBW65_04125 [Helicobacter enhydrae]
MQKQSQKLGNKSRILQRVCFVKPKKRIWEILESPKSVLVQKQETKRETANSVLQNELCGNA